MLIRIQARRHICRVDVDMNLGLTLQTICRARLSETGLLCVQTNRQRHTRLTLFEAWLKAWYHQTRITPGVILHSLPSLAAVF